MRKADIVEGQSYAWQASKYLSARKVTVLENEEYHTTRYARVDRSALYADEAFAKAHLAWALTQAFQADTTPRETEQRAAELRDAQSGAERRWFAADPRRNYRKGRGMAGAYGDASGILCTDEEGKVRLVERRQLIATWEEHEANEVAEAQARKAQAQHAAERKALQVEQRAAIRPALEAAFADSGVRAPYLSNYDSKVELSYEQLLVLLNARVEA